MPMPPPPPLPGAPQPHRATPRKHATQRKRRNRNAKVGSVINRYCLKHGVSFHALSYEKLRAEDQDEHLHFAKADVLVTASSGVL